MVWQCVQVLLLLFVGGIAAQIYGYNIWIGLIPAALIAVGVILLAGIANYIAGLFRAWQDGVLDKKQERIDRKNEAWFAWQKKRREEAEAEAFDRPLKEPPRPKPKPKPKRGYAKVHPNDSNFDRPLRENFDRPLKEEAKPKPPPPPPSKPKPRRQISKKTSLAGVD